MGAATKYLTRVERRFWLDAARSQFALSDGLFSWTWESTDGAELAAGPAGLTAFSGGPSAERARAVPAAERRAAFAAALETLHPGFGASVRGTRWMDWPADPWTRGGYSFPAPGEVTRLGPIYRGGLGRLHFCGEHTSHAFAGYMEGALASGVALARRLAARDGLAAGAQPPRVSGGLTT
jgi:monoamine oxidase